MKIKVAIPLFKDRISPRFDVCPEIWIVELHSGEVVSQEKQSMERFNLQQRIDQLISQGVDRIICGGIDSFCIGQLGNRGIGVTHNVVGEAGEALHLFIKGVLHTGFFCNGKRGKGLCGLERGFHGRGKFDGKRKM